MGRCNNRRAQERAAQDRTVPSRARFSKGPPKKTSGRGGGRGSSNGGRGGRDGGRGRGRGGGRANESVIQKLQDRAQQQRADIGGISVVKKQTTEVNHVRRKKHPLDGIDVSKLDVITLSQESVAIVERLLRAYNIWEERDDEEADEEKKSEEQFEYDVSSIAEQDIEDADGGRKHEAIVQDDVDGLLEKDSNGYSFTLLHGDDDFDEYCGDYEDEPDYSCSRDNDMIVDHIAGSSTPSENDQGINLNEDKEKSKNDADEEVESSPLFIHLTQHYSFQKESVIRALNASHKRLSMSKNTNIDSQSSDADGILLEMAMDWLSLHLKESDLRRGFVVKALAKEARAKSLMQSKSLDNHPGLKQTIKAVPHKSIAVMPKLTESQFKKETRDRICQWKRQELSTELVRMGFHMNEVESAVTFFGERLNESFISADEEAETVQMLQPASILDGALFTRLVELVGSSSASSLDPEIIDDMEEASILERDQEKEVMEAIYAEDFLVMNESGSHYRITVNATDLAPPARNDICRLHIITQIGYPLSSSLHVWFVNSTLPPSLLRRISLQLQTKARDLIGQAAVYDLVETLTENIAIWQKEFVNEEARIEESTTNNAKNDSNTDSEEDDDIDFYSTTFTAEERKKLSRRQRQRLRAVELSYARDEVLLEKQRQKEIKDNERRERIRLEDSQITSRRAEQVVEKRWKDWVEEEAEKAARKAMNEAFLREEGREQARHAAEVARREVMRFHGELEEERSVEIAASSEHDSVQLEKPKLRLKNETTTSEKAQPDMVITDTISTASAISSGTTAKTLAFTEKLRRMYEQKAKEKTEGKTGDSGVEPPSAIQLANASIKVPQDTSLGHIPSPIVTASPCMENILEDIVSTQQEQPWLVHLDARIPTYRDCTGTSQDMSKKDKVSNSLRVELERKYNNSNQGRHSKHTKKRSNKIKQFDEMLASRCKLPAYKMRNQILETIRNNQITVISGDTGCGKTTQVPQLVLDDLILRNCGADANIIVTQPRRISAIGVSERIAAERGEVIGETAGYSIRLESKKSSKTRLLLCTTGVLLRRLQVDPDLSSVSHVFVDEVHERDLNTDFLIIILKDLLARRPSLKLVLMSATLNAATFSTWFGGCPTVTIPGRAQPVQEYRLEDALEVTGHIILEDSDYAKKKKPSDTNSSYPSKTTLRRLYPKEKYGKNVIDSLAVCDESIVNYELIADLLRYICTSLEEGAILVFLPGFKEITTAMEAIGKLDYFRENNAVIHPLHSTLSSAEQTAIFQRPPDGKRKIVLSTNIAETSITIDDVVFVIDTGRVKENRYDELNKMPTLTECWVSKASSKQRRGRAGRVRPGFCWHLYSTHTHDKEIDDYQLPEMLRVGLEDLVLQILVLDLGEPSLFLQKAVNPPTSVAIKNALDLLESLGAAECNWDEVQDQNESNSDVKTSLTALGYHLATLPVHPRVGKMMIYGALFGVYDSCLTMAAAMTSRSPFISSFGNREAADEAKQSFASDDHISVLLAFNQWRHLRQRDGRKAKAFLQENFLSYTSLNNIVQLRKQLEKYMLDIGFSARANPSGLLSIESNEMHLVRAVIAAGLYPNIIIAPKSLYGKAAGELPFRGQKGDVYLHPCTIAFSRKEMESRYCVYHEIVKTSKVYVRDCTTVSKFAILLFGGALKVYQSHGVAAVDDWLKFRIAARPATLVKYLRTSMETLLLEKIMNPELDVNASLKGKAVIDAVSALLKLESVQV